MRATCAVVSVAMIAASSLVAHPAVAAWGSNPATNVALCTATNEQYYSDACSDGAGGAIVAWSDFRTGAGDVYAQRVSVGGNVMWAPNGNAICSLLYSQYQTKIVSDGAGGAYVVWTDGRKDGSDYDIYAQRVGANGSALWTPQGVRVCGAAGVQSAPLVVSDGAGGAIVAWADGRPGSPGLWAQRIEPDSTVLWPADGVQLSSGEMSGTVSIASDGQGGALFSWSTGVITNLMIVQGVDNMGAPRWAHGVVVTNGNPDHFAFPDGAGGFIFGWDNANYIFARHFDQTGALVWTRTVNDGSSGGLTMCSDGGTGAFMCWAAGSGDLVAQHLDVDGNLAWPAAGALVAPAPSHNFFALKSDGEGGVAFAWSDYRAGPNADIYAQRLDASGLPRWTSGGTAVCTATFPQYFSHLVPSTNGGWIVEWEDVRGGSSRDIYCQNVDRYGYLGDASPKLLSVTDVPADNGGMVNVQWSRSYLDRTVDPAVVEYRVLRQICGTSNWEVVGTAPATTAPTYVTAAPTCGDDVTTYLVEAHGSHTETEPFWSSASLSGQALDQLPPPRPTSFLGANTNGITAMRWDASPAADFARYRLYRSEDPFFGSNPSNLLAETTETQWTDHESGAFYYRLSAVDVHGNESPSTRMGAWTTDVSPATCATFTLDAPRPHPVRGSCSIHFEVARDGIARLGLFDLAGRRVATLHDGPALAGPHEVSLSVDGAGARGLANGLYLLRLEAGGRVATRRLLVAR